MRGEQRDEEVAPTRRQRIAKKVEEIEDVPFIGDAFHAGRGGTEQQRLQPADRIGGALRLQTGGESARNAMPGETIM